MKKYEVICEVRNAIPRGQKQLYAKMLAQQFKKLFSFLDIKSTTIGSYIPMEEEISPIYIEQHIGDPNGICYPVIHPYRKRSLWFVPKKKFTINKFCIKEPVFELKQVTAPWELDLIIVPMVAFNKKNNVLEWGGGFYDNALKSCKKFNKEIFFLGIAFEEQENENIKINAWDVEMDAVVTPKEVIY